MPFKPGASGNPNGRPRKVRTDADKRAAFPELAPEERSLIHTAHRHDGWYNLLTGHGTSTHDKRMGTQYCADLVSYEQAMELWRGDDLGARIVETKPGEMTRAGWEFTVDAEADGNDEEYGKELTEKVTARWDALKLQEALFTALCYEQAYGGAAILLGAEDGSTDWALPLTDANVRKFDWLTVLEPRELTPLQWYTDPRHAKFGKPEIWQYTPIITGSPKAGDLATQGTLKIHESRLVVLDGTRVSRLPIRGQYTGWGDSIFVRVHRVLADFNVSWSAAGILVHDFAQAVFKIKGLAEMVGKDNKALFQARMAGLALSMSTARAILIDSEEEYKREQTPVTGLPELLDRFCVRLAAAAGFPVMLLFGEAPGGLNASGASGDQLRMFYDQMAVQQMRKLMDPIRRITTLILSTMGGAPDNWSIKFKPLWQESTKEQTDARATQAATDKTYFEMGVLTSDEIREARFGGDDYSHATPIANVSETDEDMPPEELAEYAAQVAPPVPGAPATPAPGAAAPAGTDIQKEALNGAQVTSLIEVITASVTGAIPRESAMRILMLAFQVPQDEANALLGPVDFKPTQPDPPPAPFGGGGGFPPKAAEPKPAPEV